MTGRPLLPPIEVAPRLDRLRREMTERAIDALLVIAPANVRYLTGFSGSAGRLLVDSTHALLVTDRRYGERAETETAAAGFAGDVEIVGSVFDAAVWSSLVGGRREGDSGELFVEAEHLSWAERDVLAEHLTLAPAVGVVEKLRTIKEPAEVARIESAASITDEALSTVLPMLAEAPAEADVAFALEAAIRRGGADGPAYEPIVASGPNSAVPHHSPGGRRVHPGDLVIIDVGARCDGYRSDMTRTYLVGDASPEQVALVKLVSDLHERGVAAVRDGVSAEFIDDVCRTGAAQAGRLEEYLHSTGHGVGLDIHETPILRRGGATLHAGYVVTVEPGVYVSGLGGARVEDTVLVTSDGCRRLTGSARQPFLPVG